MRQYSSLVWHKASLVEGRRKQLLKWFFGGKEAAFFPKWDLVKGVPLLDRMAPKRNKKLIVWSVRKGKGEWWVMSEGRVVDVVVMRKMSWEKGGGIQDLRKEDSEFAAQWQNAAGTTYSEWRCYGVPAPNRITATQTNCHEIEQGWGWIAKGKDARTLSQYMVKAMSWR